MINSTNKFLVIILFLNMFLLCLFSWCWADDFGMYNNIIKSGGILNSLVRGYFNWDGRFFSLISLIQALLLRLHSPETGAIIWLIFFFLAIWYASKNIILFAKFSKSEIFVFSFFVFYGLREVVSECVFWLTGGVYSASIFLLMIWFYEFNNLLKKSELYSFKKYLLYFIPLTVFSSQNGPQVCVSMIASLFLFSFIKDRSFLKQIWFYKRILPQLILIIIFCLITILAPGNSARISQVEQKVEFTNILTLFNNFTNVFLIYLKYSKHLFLSLAIVLFPLTLGLKFSFKETFVQVRENLISIISYLLIAISSISPFIFYPDFAAPRTILVFSFFMILFLTPIIVLIYKFLFMKFKILFLDRYYNLVLFFTLLPLILIQVSWIERSFKMKLNMESKYEFLESKRNTNESIEIELGENDLPQIKVFNDLQLDSSHYINHDMAEYYNVKSIKIKSNNGK